MNQRQPMAPSGPPTAVGGKPPLLLVAVDMGRHLGTEPGKAWNWACALAVHYRLHIVTAPAIAERCRGEAESADWTWHVTRCSQPMALGLAYYRAYARWCGEVPGVVRAAVRATGCQRLHHITLGSFRMLPRYDLCGVEYSLGPLGGGEAIPSEYLRTARMPTRERWMEAARPWINQATARRPGAAAVLRNARLALATTEETERVLQVAGARRTGVVFPDRVPPDIEPMTAGATERVSGVGREVRLIWAGRALWWKGGQLAVELMGRLTARGVSARLTMYTYGPALEAWRRQIAAAKMEAHCEVRGFVPRKELLRALGAAHGFVYPTLHDSSSSALLEAYALGVPSLTTGVGGPAVVATPETGYNERAPDLDVWLERAVQRVEEWQRAPERWRRASEAARQRSAAFGAGHLAAAVEAWLAPGAWTR